VLFVLALLVIPFLPNKIGPPEPGPNAAH
jgi:hypothetical protein